MDLMLDILVMIFFVMLLGLMLDLVLVFVMHILMPRNVLKTYFKEPYFSATEIAMFTGFPFGYMRTAMFMRALGFPASGEKRGVENAHKLAPVWYCKLSKYSIIFFIPAFSLLIISAALGGLLIALFE